MKTNLTLKDNQRLQEILTRELGVSPDQLRGEARFKEDLGADSLTTIEITMAVEEQFNVSIPEERLEQIGKVDDLYQALGEAMKTAAGPE